MEDIGKIIGLVITLAFLVPIMIMLTGFISDLNKDQCEPYRVELQDKDLEIESLKTKLNQTEMYLEECRSDYDKLLAENITKQDIKSIKQDINQTKIDMTLLNQRFENIENNYVNIYNPIIYALSISFAFNLMLGLLFVGDFISFTVFNVDLKKRLVQWFKRKFPDKTKPKKE